MASERQTSTNPPIMVTAILVCLWYASSIVAISTSKKTMQLAPVPLVLSAVQFFMSTLVSGLVLRTQRLLVKPREETWVLFGTSATYTAGFFFTNYAFSLAHASFVETVKSGEPISTVFLAWIMLGEHERFVTYASLAPVVVGVAMASLGEAGGGTIAFCATVGSNFGFSARAVLAKQLKRHHPKSISAANDVALFYHISWMGLVALVPFAVWSDGNTMLKAFTSSEFDRLQFVTVILLNGLMFTGYNLFSFMVLSRVSTATHAVLNVCRRVCIIGVTSVVFGVQLSLFNKVGLLIGVTGMLLFAHSKSAATVKASKTA